jgi:transposase-like protein
MTAVVDISCPSCDSASPVRKVGIGEYHCVECDRAFTHEDVEP